MKITQQQAIEFLEKINENDKVAIVTHNDMDGFCSGKLFYEFCKKKNCKDLKVFIVAFEGALANFDLTDFNKILISDLGPSFVSKKLNEIKNKEILYTDHHQEDSTYPIPENVFELRTISEGYIPSSRTVYEITEKENNDLKWISVLGVIADMGHIKKENKEFLESFYSETGKDFDFYFNRVIDLNSAIVYFSPEFENTFELFKKLKKVEDVEVFKEFNDKINEELDRLKDDYERNSKNFGKIIYYNIESRFPAIKSTFITSLSSDNPGAVYIFSAIKGEKISLSARNQSNEYDVSLVLKELVKGLKDSVAGGHKVAAGGQVMKEDLETFKERLKQIKIEEFKIK